MFKLPEIGILYKYVQLGQGDQRERERDLYKDDIVDMKYWDGSKPVVISIIFWDENPVYIPAIWGVLTRTHAERRNNTSMGIDMLRMHVVNKSKNGSGHVLALLYLNIVPPKTDMEPKELGVEDDVATVAK